MSVEKTILESYESYGRVLKVSNGTIEAYITIDLGPRIVRFAFCGGTNIMYNDAKKEHYNSGDEYDQYYYKGARWYNYGGHRLWISPESCPETYYPDNDPVEYKLTENGAVFTPNPQKENGVQHQIELVMHSTKPEMKVIHRVTNISDKPKEFALWALTVLGQDGCEIIPQNTHDTGLLANRQFAVWPYADLRDDRIYLGHKYITLKQSPDSTAPFKIGLDNFSGLGYYVIDDTVFIKKYYPNHPDGIYPDGGMSFETYTNELFLELETLGELKTVAPGQTEEHIEGWFLASNPGEFDRKDDDSIDSFINKLKY